MELRLLSRVSVPMVTRRGRVAARTILAMLLVTSSAAGATSFMARPTAGGAGAADLQAAADARRELVEMAALARARGMDLRGGVGLSALRAVARGDGFPAAPRASGDPATGGVAAAAVPAPDAKVKPAKAKGKVTDAAGKAVKGASIVAYRKDGTSFTYAGQAVTKKNGTFIVKGLPPGSYVFIATASGYLSQLYAGRNCGANCSLSEGTPVALAPKQLRTGIDFSLQRAGALAGKLRNEVGQAVPGVVWLLDGSGSYLSVTQAGSDGSFRFANLMPGTYRLLGEHERHVATLGGGLGCPFSDCDLSRAAPAVVSAGAEARQDITLRRGGRLSGLVRGPGASALEGIWVFLLAPDGSYFFAVAVTGADGRYAIGGVPAGEYQLVFADLDDVADVVDEAWNDRPCPELICGSETLVTVQPAQDRTGLDATLGPGGSVTGRVTDAATGGPLAGVLVGAVDPATAFYIAYGYSAADGSYRIDDLPPGRYFVYSGSQPYIVNLAGVGDCPSFYCSTSAARELLFAGTESIGGIDFALRRGGSIPGVVVDAAGAPLRSVQVRAVGRSGRTLGTARSNAQGAFTISGLEPGRYWLHATDTANDRPRFAPLLHPATPCALDTCTFTISGAIDLKANQEAGARTIRLTGLGGTAAGTVRGVGGVPLHGALVYVVAADGTALGSGFSDGLGEWEVSGLVPGAWRARVEVPGALGELWSGPACPAGGCDLSTGNTFTVIGGARRTGVDFDLAAEGGRISGRLVDAATGGGATGNFVRAVDAAGRSVGWALVGASGNFALFGLPSGNLRVVSANSYGRYLDVAFPNTPCPSGACFPAAGTPLAIGGGNEVTGIDLQITGAATIGGRITSTATGGPLLGTRVEVYDAAGHRVSRTYADREGGWESYGLPPGTYFVATSGVIDHGDRVYGGGACEATCDPAAGTPIVLGGASISDIALALDAVAFP